MAQTYRKNTCEITLSILRFISVTCGIVFLYESSFSAEQFEDASKEEVVLTYFGLFLVFVFAFVITPWICVGSRESVCPSHFLLKVAVNIFALTLASLEIFLSKYPRFNTQSEAQKFSTEGGETRQRQIFSMCSFGMFAFLALLLSRKGQDALEFGVFNLLLELTIEASMEISGENHGPNLWYLLGASLYCAVLVLIRSYLGSPSRQADVEEDGAITRSTADEGRRTCEITLSILRFIFVTCGIVFLYESSFSAEQFEDASKEEVVLMYFGLFLVFVFTFVITPWICVGSLECICHSRFLLKAAVNIFALTLASLEIFLSKYPRFNTQSEAQKFSTEGGETRQRQIFSMCSFGMFAFLALLLSRKGQDVVEFGVLNLLLELTIEASMEIPGENHGSNLWYLLGASVYCAVLVLTGSYLGSPSRGADVEGGGRGSGSQGRGVESDDDEI